MCRCVRTCLRLQSAHSGFGYADLNRAMSLRGTLSVCREMTNDMLLHYSVKQNLKFRLCDIVWIVTVHLSMIVRFNQYD